MADKKPRYTTPTGFAKWAWVHKPKAAFAGDPNKDPKYMIDVCFDIKDPAWAKWGTDFRTVCESLAKGAKLPIKHEEDEAGQRTGRLYVTFKTGEKFKPEVFDRYGQPIPESVLIGNESKVRISYTVNHYEGFGGGINLYLSAVMVMELVEYKGRGASAYGFDVEELPQGTMAGGPPSAADDFLSGL
jgi:hypothetical protein